VVDTEEQPVLVRREENEKSETPLNANNAKIDIPMQADLNKKHTVQLLAEYTAQVKKMVLALEDNPFDGLDEHDEKPKPILEDVRPTLIGDGLPSHMLSSLLKVL
jgi:hypothetical protein